MHKPKLEEVVAALAELEKAQEVGALMPEGMEHWAMDKDIKEVRKQWGKQVEQLLTLTSVDAVGKMH